MSPEIPGSRDNLPSKPKNTGGNGDDRPNGGYPPKGYDQAKRQLQSQEAEIKAAEAQKIQEMDEEFDIAAILPVVEKQLPDCKPSELAAKGCLKVQKENQELDETYSVIATLKENPADIKPDVERFIKENINQEKIKETEQETEEITQETAKTKEAIAQRQTEQKTLTAEATTQKTKIADQATEIERGKTKTLKLKSETATREKTASREENGKTRDLVKNGEVKEDYATVKQLQAKFNEIRASKGTIGALKTLLGPEGVKTPEMKAIVQRVLSTATALVSALPGRADVVNRILDRSNINLGARSPLQIFAGFLAEADKSNELTEEDKSKIRQILHKQIDISSGSDMKKALEQGRGVRMVTDKDGNTHPEIIKYDEDNPAKIQEGQYLYTDKKGNNVLKMVVDSDKPPLKFILPTNDEAEMSKIGVMAQVMDTMSDYNMANAIYQKGFDLKDGGAIRLDWPKDWITTEKVLGVFFGGTVGWDGSLLSKQQTNQMKHLMQKNAAKGDATRADWDEKQAVRDFKKQGIIDSKGNINWDRFKEVINPSRDGYMTTLPRFEDGVEGK